MDIKEEAITEYLTKGTGYRQSAEKYGISRTTINKWVMIHQGIHNLAPTQKQQKYYLSAMNSNGDKIPVDQQSTPALLEQRIALLEKQLAWEKLRVETLDTMINIAEKQLDISIRKKSGSQSSPRSKEGTCTHKCKKHLPSVGLYAAGVSQTNKTPFN